MSMLLPKHLPLISLKDTVVFPQSIISIHINSDHSKKLVQKAFNMNKLLFFSCLENPQEDSKKVYKIGCVGFIMKMKTVDEACIKILIQGLKKACISEVKNDFVSLNYFSHNEKKDSERYKKTIVEIKNSLNKLSQFKDNFSHEILAVLNSIKDPNQFCDMLINNLDLKSKTLQKALEIEDFEKKLQFTKKLIQDELEISQLKGRLQKLIKNDSPKPLVPSNKDFMYQQGNNHKKEDVREYTQNLSAMNLPTEVKKEAFKQLSRLDKMHTESSEASIIRNYLDWILDLPWNILSEDNLDLNNAQKVLDEDHLGLKKIKERILEFLAVRNLKRQIAKGPILCFSGPPGVGKTSLGKSIAKALGRSYYRISLGGLKDEAEIRGHRRTYVGAMPGKLIQALKQCKTKNPVIVLDEIDKLCSDFKGDPSSALLEVLDPEQNQNFKDDFLNLDFDLSQVFFIATANLIHNVPPALKDRLEVINLSGYTLEEKIQISVKHLLFQELSNNGLPENHIQLEESALIFLIQSYTKEAGLRNLKRQLSSLCRKVAKKYVLGEKDKLIFTKKDIMDMLGGPYFHPEDSFDTPHIGMTTGLAWTEAGGEILPIEALKIRSKKSDLILTGKLGEVMKESAKASLSYVKSYVQKFNFKIEEDFFDCSEIHIHLPGGAIPKDGPSDGVALASTLLSLVTNIPIKNDLAMTGEITLSGRILPVGGIKEKILAAFNSGGIKKVILPKKNEKDLDEIPKKIRNSLNFSLVSNLEEVFEQILLFEPTKSPISNYLKGKDLERVA